ncbi:hypothetical protein [Deinococcus sp. UYEF24]
MYPFVLGLHNTLRWGVLLAAVYLLVLVVAGLTGRRAWTRQESVATSIYTGFMYLQLLVGLSLYIGVSPYMQAILDNFGAAIKSAETRFFAVEHVTGMLLAVLFAHLGNLLHRRQATDTGKYRVAGLWFGLSLLCVLALIPWWRPLLRL